MTITDTAPDAPKVHSLGLFQQRPSMEWGSPENTRFS